MRYIYILRDPRSLEIRYVGQTNDVNRRFRSHINRSLIENDSEFDTYKSRWIRKLNQEGFEPLIEVVDTCDTLEESNIKESYYVKKYTSEGYQLTNSHVGDVTEFSQETKNKMSFARKGKKLEELVGKERAQELKNYYSERAKMKNPNKSNNLEVREKISNALKEYFSDKKNHWAYGLKMNEDHNEKLRLAKLNNSKNVGNKKPRTESQKDKIRQLTLGKKINRFHILQYSIDGGFIKEWKSLRDVEKNESTLKRNQISKCCKGERESYAGYIWKYKTE